MLTKRNNSSRIGSTSVGLVTGGFQSSGAPQVHFGLPPSTETVDVTVTWPNGGVQEVRGVGVNQYVSILRAP